MNVKYWMAAVGLLFLFIACEKDIAEGFGDGKKVEIFFSTNITNYHTAADLVRSGGVREPESRTVYINDSIYLISTLAPDSELRAPEAFIDGQKIRFVAFNAGTQAEVDSKVYSWSMSTGKFIPDTDPLGVDPDGATIYRFVAYSYFGETNEPSMTINLSKDLVWGKSVDGTVVDTEMSRTISINMRHLFAQVKVLVKSGIENVTIDDLDDVEIEGETWTTVDPFDGSFNTTSAVTQDIDFDTDELPADEIESETRLIFPVTVAPAKMKFGTIEISAIAPLSNQTVSFNSTLDAGTSYTLVVNVKRCVWSRSNIYWEWYDDDDGDENTHLNGGHMTFVRAGMDLTKQGYQGLFFKWGSLTGISPAGNWVNDATPIYEAGSSMPSTASSWASILHVSDISVEELSAPDTGTQTGDICKYIDVNYRLPSECEFGTVTSGGWNEGWTWHGDFGAITTTTDDDGTYDFIDNDKTYAVNTAKGNVIFPASGDRGLSGNLYNTGSAAFYWIGLGVKNVQYAFDMSFNINDMWPIGSTYRDFGFSVRCVQN